MTLKSAFLSAISEMGVVKYAATAAGISRETHYQWLKSDPGYAESFDAAMDNAADLMEQEARRRAFEGVEEPVGFYQGQASEYVQKYSDVLMMFLLKGARPEKYKDRFYRDEGHRPAMRPAPFVVRRSDDPDPEASES